MTPKYLKVSFLLLPLAIIFSDELKSVLKNKEPKRKVKGGGVARGGGYTFYCRMTHTGTVNFPSHQPLGVGAWASAELGIST